MIKTHLSRDHTRLSHRIPLVLSGDHSSILNYSRAITRGIGFYDENSTEDVDGHVGTEMSSTSCPAAHSSAPNSLTLHEGVPPPTTCCYLPFYQDATADKRIMALTQLFRYCLASGCTVRAYRQLVELDVLDVSYVLPKKRQALRDLIMDRAEGACRWPTLHTFSLPCYRSMNIASTPFMTVMDALRLWLSLPVVLSAVRDSMIKHLPDNLLDFDLYDAMVKKQVDEIASGTHIYETVADGSEYLRSIRACVPKFESAYMKALEDDIEVIVCTVAFYDDSYRKQKDSLVNQHMFCLTLCKYNGAIILTHIYSLAASVVEAATGEASLTGLASLIMMIADANGTKTLGLDVYWRILIDEMCELEKGILDKVFTNSPTLTCFRFTEGVRMVVDDKVCLVICIGMCLLADTLALKAMVGLSPSTSPTCYVRMPCRTCEVLMENLSESLQKNFACVTRSISTYSDFFRYNGHQTGVPMSGWLKEMMKQYGILRISEFIRLTSVMSPRMLGTDLLHAVYLGTLKQHFIHAVDLLTSAEHGCKKGFSNVWKSISKCLHAYSKGNSISSCWKFASAKEFKSRVKGGNMRELAKVSPFLFHIIRLVDLEPSDNTPVAISRWKKHIRVFNFWLLHVQIAQQLENHAISSEELINLDEAICNLLQYFHDDFVERRFPKFGTINVHYYKHIVDQIRWMGPMRIASNDARERLIQWLKGRYRNTGGSGKEATVYQIYLDNLFFQVQDYIRGGDISYER